MKLNGKNNISLWQLIGFAAVSVLGTLLHFLYDLTESTLAALFSGVNESTWEHMKLLFFPMFLFAIFEYFFVGKEYKSFWCIKLKGILLGLVLIPIIFYTLKGVFGSTPDWINITIFFVSAAVAYVCETRQLKKENIECKNSKSAFVLLCVIAAAFWIFTFIPPEIALFQDPIDGSLGFNKN